MYAAKQRVQRLKNKQRYLHGSFKCKAAVQDAQVFNELHARCKAQLCGEPVDACRTIGISWG